MDTTEDTHVRLYPLTFVDEGTEVVIGRMDVESYAVFPQDAAAVVRRLQEGASTQQAAAWYADTYHEDADIADLIEMLRELRFVREDAPSGTQKAPEPAAALRFPRLARAAFSAPAWIGYGLVTCAGIAAMVRWSDLRPVASHTFFSPSLVIVVLTLIFAQAPGMALHESFHVLAGRRLGLPARVSIGRRLYFVVFQTTMTGLMSVPRSKRILPFCAGLVADITAMNLMVCIAAYDQWANGSLGFVGKLALAVSFSTLLRIVWQFMVFMETDLYHVIATALYCPDLHRMTRSYLSTRVRRVARRPARSAEESTWTDRDRLIVRRYAPVVLLGGVFSVGGMVFGTVPIFAGLISRLADAIDTGDPLTLHFWDGMAVGLGTLFEMSLVMGMMVRGRLKERRERAQA